MEEGKYGGLEVPCEKGVEVAEEGKGVMVGFILALK